MTTYCYRCQSCGNERQRDFPIGTARRVDKCDECGGLMRQVLGVGLHIAAAALPNKRAGVIAADRKDTEFASDNAAYRRMRRRGLQPNQVDGATKLEDRVDDQLDITHAKLYDLDPTCPRETVKERIIEGYTLAAEIQRETA